VRHRLGGELGEREQPVIRLQALAPGGVEVALLPGEVADVLAPAEEAARIERLQVVVDVGKVTTKLRGALNA
jgi:hypothetical protein